MLNKYSFVYSCILLMFLVSAQLSAQRADFDYDITKDPVMCKQASETVTGNHALMLGDMQIPDAHLVNHLGEKVHFSELIAGKVVALNFIFTTCTTICPPMGANLTALKREMADKVASGELAVLSISIDPVTDTPERLKAWSSKFNPGEGWTLLTGEKSEVDGLLKGLKVFAPLIEEHAPIIIMGKQGTGHWVRTNGLAPVSQLKETLLPFFEYQTPAVLPVSEKSSPELNYFTNVKLVNQYGEEMRLYNDLMKDKVVVVAPFFLRCQASCPVMSAMMRDLQTYYGDRIGKEINLISISVDPTYDTPERVRAYAENMGAERGWYLLTGAKENVDLALLKLGNRVVRPEDHKNIIMIGNVPTRLWKKANGLASSRDIVKIVDSVRSDDF